MMKCGFYCAGIGGAAVAAQQLGYTISWMIDNDPKACQVWKKNLPGQIINKDACNVNPKTLEKVNYLHYAPDLTYFNPAANLHYPDVNPLPGIDQHFLAIVKWTKPEMITIECNTKYRDSDTANEIYSYLLKKYYVYTKFCHYHQLGLPQKRSKTLIIATKDPKFKMMDWLNKKQEPIFWNKYITNIPLGEPIKFYKKLTKYIKKQNFYSDRNVIIYRKQPSSAEETSIAPNIYPSTGNRGSLFAPKNRRDATALFIASRKKWYEIPHRFFLRIQGFPDWFKLEQDNLHFFKLLGQSTPPPIIKQILLYAL